MAIGKKGMQYNSEAPRESTMTGNLSGKMEGKPMKGSMGKSRTTTMGGPGGGGERKGMMPKRGGRGRMGY